MLAKTICRFLNSSVPYKRLQLKMQQVANEKLEWRTRKHKLILTASLCFSYVVFVSVF